MAKKKFTDFLNRFFYEDGTTSAEEVKPSEEGKPELTQEAMAEFEVAISDEGGESVTERAKKIIEESQAESDNDEYPDICNVQSVLDNTGVDADHELIRKILLNYEHCDPKALETDGNGRKQAILTAIEQTKQKAAALKSEKAQDEQNLLQAEKDAETVCTETISQANIDSERAIEEEKARSAAIIAEIRKRTDEAAEAAKQQRDDTLQSIAAQRAENEAALRKADELAAETEKHGQTIINQIDLWLSYLK